MPKKLTPELISLKTKSNRFDKIDKLNLWGNDLDDVSVLSQLVSLEVLSLSVNQIDTLQHFRKCKLLKELYLRNNNVSELLELKYLSSLKRLRKLTLSENPVAEKQNYRLAVISVLPDLVTLDDRPVSEDERSRAATAKDIFVEDYIEERSVEEPNKFEQMEYVREMPREQGFNQRQHSMELKPEEVSYIREKQNEERANQRQYSKEYAREMKPREEKREYPYQKEEDDYFDINQDDGMYENPIAKYANEGALRKKQSMMIESTVKRGKQNVVSAIQLLLQDLSIEDLEDVIYCVQRRKEELLE